MTALQARISKKLRSIGIGCGLKGARCLATAIELVYNDPDYYLGAITKRLYPKVALVHSDTVSRVERSIRHTIERAYTTVGEDIIAATLGCPCSLNTRKLANGGFIFAVAEVMSCEDAIDNKKL